ncbi:hypothetical protein Tco_0458451 [Tanacetum coccineum]
MCSGFGPARDTCSFPESDLVWSSFMGQGLVQPEPHVFSQGAAVSVSLYVRSESDVDEDSWITFSDVSSSG